MASRSDTATLQLRKRQEKTREKDREQVARGKKKRCNGKQHEPNRTCVAPRFSIVVMRLPRRSSSY